MKILLVYEIIPENTNFYVFDNINPSSELYMNLVDANGHYGNYEGEHGENEGTEFLNTYLEGLDKLDVKDLPAKGSFDVVFHSGFGRKDMQGIVEWFSAPKGFGFIAREDGEGDVFVHWSSIKLDGYKKLEANQKVSFDIVDGPKGKPQADNVTVIE